MKNLSGETLYWFIVDGIYVHLGPISELSWVKKKYQTDNVTTKSTE